MGPLSGVRVIEMAGLAPVPYAGMILADFGADVVRVDRPQSAPGRPDPTRDYLARGKRSVAVNMKDPRGVEVLLSLLERADVLVEPFRPGVMERLGTGPKVALARNPGLVYARLTGWGQDGEYAPMAGHDINYIALSGALSLFGRKGEKPLPPVNLVGDFAGGGMLCALGIVLALFERTRSGKGQVIDSAMVDGAANLATFLCGFRAAGIWSDERGTNMLDTGAPFYDTYETSEGKYVSVGAIEPQFYAALLDGLGLSADDMPHQHDRQHWEATRTRFTEIFASRTRDDWSAVFDGTDACVAPVLTLGEAPMHAHNRRRGTFVRGLDDVEVPAPAPRLSRTPGAAASTAPLPGQDTISVLSELGIAAHEIESLRTDGVIA
jgi:alpha-methylacyl-CoA racemase